jgi:type I restriction enzyme R subunit
MKYRDADVQPLGPAKFDFADLLTTKEIVEFGPEHSAVSVSQYREMVEKLITELTESNPILQKIKAGQEISEAEAQELATLLHDEHPHITEDLLKHVYKNRKAKFIQFIRHILGLEILESFPETVTRAFEQFIHSHTNLSSRQLDFLNLLKEFILDKEIVQKRDLIESPFTVLHPQGIRGLFTPAEINEILELAKKVAA